MKCRAKASKQHHSNQHLATHPSQLLFEIEIKSLSFGIGIEVKIYTHSHIIERYPYIVIVIHTFVIQTQAWIQ